MTKEIVVRMHQRNVAMAHRQDWRARIERERAQAEAERIEDITRAVLRTLQQTRLERAAAYFRAVFR